MDIKSRIEKVNNEIVVLQTATKIALVNLGNVSRSLQRAFSDTEALADKKLQSRKESLERIPAALEVLGVIRIHPVFGKEEKTLRDFFNKDDISAASKICEKTHQDVERRIEELKLSMEDFIRQGEDLKTEVLQWQQLGVHDGGQVREISLIADKVERGISLISYHVLIRL
jgi:Autophagy protein ATG17-like domain